MTSTVYRFQPITASFIDPVRYKTISQTGPIFGGQVTHTPYADDLSGQSVCHYCNSYSDKTGIDNELPSPAAVFGSEIGLRY